MSAQPERTEALLKTSFKATLHTPGTADSLGLLRTVLLLVWALASFGLMFFARDLQMHMGAWPFSFWLAAQGLLVVFVLIVFVYAWAANRAEHQADEATAPP